MNARDVKGLAVVILTDADKIGNVDDILFDAQYRQVLGFRVKRGLLGKSETVLRRDVTAVGRDAITVASRASLNQEERFHELVGAATLAKVEGTHVVTEGGTRLGSIRSVELDDQVQRVVYYTLDRSLRERLFGEEPRLNAEFVRGIGDRGIMIVANEAGMTPEELGQRQQEQAAQTPATQTSPAGQPSAQGQPAQPMAPGTMAAGAAGAAGAAAASRAGQRQPAGSGVPQGQTDIGQAQPGVPTQPGVQAQPPIGPGQPGGYQDQPPMRRDDSQLGAQGVRGDQMPPSMPGSDQAGRQARQDMPVAPMGQPAPHQQPLSGQQQPLGQPPMQGQPGVRQGPMERDINQMRGPVEPGVDQPQRPMAPPPDQGVRNQGMPNQGLPNQGLPNQGYPNQGMPDQGYPSQGLPNQRIPDQGLPNQGPPNQGYPSQGAPNQGMPNQGMPNQGMPNQGMPNQDQGQWGQGMPERDRPSLPAENEQPLPPTYP